MIIREYTDTDFYIMSMMQASLHNYPGAWVRFEFKWRNWAEMKLNCSLEQFLSYLDAELDNLCSLRFNDMELNYMAAIPFFKRDFIEYLRLFQLNRSYINASIEKTGPAVTDVELKIVIEGPLPNVIMFEVPTLAIVSQLYTDNNGVYGMNWLKEGRKRLDAKMEFLESNVHKDEDFSITDFGTRRRAHVDWHNAEIMRVKKRWPRFLTGTSNIMMAMRHKIPVRGTMAHFWIQIHQQLGTRLIDSQAAALQCWADEYRGELGIALSDTLGFDAFLKDFDRYFALLYDGCRQDSGNPYEWGEKLINHYNSLRVSSKTKDAVFSDGLTFQVALDLYRRFRPHFRSIGAGVGTYFTNDCGFVAPQIVIKNTMCNGQPTAKISDSEGKGMCTDSEFEANLKRSIKEKIDGRHAGRVR